METFKTQDGTVITYTNGKVDITKPVGRWKAKDGEDFYYLDSGDVMQTSYACGYSDDEYKYNNLNMFKTKEEAEAKREYNLAICILTLAIEELNGGWKPHWNQINTAGSPSNIYRDDAKYEILYDHFHRRYKTINLVPSQSMLLYPYCKTEAIAQEIIDKYSKELDILRSYQL